MILRHFTIPLSLLALVLCTASPIRSVQSQEKKGAEQKPADAPVVRIETELVQVDVVVTDKQGKLVRDLRREDFELHEDGKKQEITHFAVGTAVKPATWLTAERKKPGEAKTTTAEISAGRYVVLAVDDFHLAPENLILTKRTLLKFINDQMVGGDQVAVVTTSGAIGMFQQFTNDRAVLERAVNRLSVQTRTVTSPFDTPRITDYQAELIDRGDQDAIEVAVQEILRLEPAPAPQPGGGRGGARNAPNPEGGISPRERAMLQAQSKARMIVAQNAHYTRATLGTLESVIRSLRSLPGRKMMVLMTDGFFLGGNSSSQIYDLRRITDAATRAGVVIYSIDARGLVATPPGGDASDPGVVDPNTAGARARMEMSAVDARRDGMHALAADTGGKAFFNNNDLNAGLQRVLDDNEIYYVLAYEPLISRRDGRFHQIAVRIAGRPELKVRTRKGYLAEEDKAEKPPGKNAAKQKEKSPEKVAQEAQTAKQNEMRRGLGSLFPLREIPVDLAADFLNIANGGSCALINAQIGGGGLSLDPAAGLNRTVLDLMVVVFDEQGKVANSYGDRVVIDTKQGGSESAIQRGFYYQKLIPLKPGFHQARIAVREDGSSRLGSASRWIEVPDLGKKQLTLSSILLTSGEERPSQPQPQQPGAGAGYQMQVSSPTRKFKSGSNLDFLVFAYNARADKGPPDLVLQPQVYTGSKLILATPLAKVNLGADTDPQRIPYAARLSLDGFEAGEYELRVILIDRSTKATANRRVNFTVE